MVPFLTPTGLHRRHRAARRGRERRTPAGRGRADLYRRRARQGQISQTGAGADDQRGTQRPSDAHGAQEAAGVRWVCRYASLRSDQHAAGGPPSTALIWDLPLFLIL